MIRLLLTPLTISIAFWALLGPSSQNKSDLEVQIQRGNSRGVAFLEQLSYEAAAREFSGLLDRDPDFVPAHVNLGIALFNLQRYEEASQSFETALGLEPKQIQSHYMMGLIYRNQDQAKKAKEAFQQVARQDPEDSSTQYYLGLLSSRDQSYQKAISHFRKVLSWEPFNASAHYNLAIALTRNGQTAEGRLEMQQFQKLQGKFGATTLGLQYLEQGRYSFALENLNTYLSPLPTKTNPEIQIQFQENAVGAGLDFLHGGPGKASLEVASVSELVNRVVSWVGSGSSFGDYNSDGQVDLFLANSGPGYSPSSLFRNLGDGTFEETTQDSGIQSTSQTMHGIWGDYDNDSDLDLYLINYGPNILYRNEGDSTFVDITGQAGVGDSSWGSGGMFVDYDHDGDLDLFVSNLMETPTYITSGATFPKDFEGAGNTLYRNNSNGTFTDVSIASGLDGGRQQTWSSLCTDFDNRRDVDFYFINLGSPNQLFSNQRDGTFLNKAGSARITADGNGIGVGIGDLAHESSLDLVLPTLTGTENWLWKLEKNHRYSPRVHWQPADWDAPSQTHTTHFFDFDNDGDLDLLVVAAPLLNSRWEGSHRNFYLLANHQGHFQEISSEVNLDRFQGLPIRGVSLADYDRDGDLDFVANVNGSRPLLFRNQGGNQNNWVSLALQGTNSNRNGFGTKVEVRSGRLLQKTELRGSQGFMSQSEPIAHFGLGQRSEIDSVRLLWPGGVLQSEIDKKVNQELQIKELDRKGTSCPILYTWDGNRYVFQTDFLGGSAYGYLVAPGTFNYPDTDEYVKLDQSQIALEDGRLAITLNNQLEEVIMFDLVQLLVVDHPSGYEVYPNEKLLPGPPYTDFRLLTFSNPHPPTSAVDGKGQDILSSISHADGQYPDLFRNLPFKGYAEPHQFTLDLGAPREGNTFLLMHAWIDYADSTSNLAASQAGLSLTPPYLQVQDAQGKWVTVIKRMGFPAGLPKPMTVDLSGKFLSNSRKVRIHTNMRIHWDQILVELEPPHDNSTIFRLSPLHANLQFLGFPSSHSWPQSYDRTKISPTASWKVHVGNYTRFGDVRPLLLKQDDMFVTTRSGDEIAVVFDLNQLPETPKGWRREYIIYVDGFGKDMDIHSASPDSVGPLPFHGMSRFPYDETEHYPRTPAHQRYLQQWNTRRVERWY